MLLSEYNSMAITDGAAESQQQQKKRGRIPPKRGQIKMKIICNFVSIICRGAEKVGRILARRR
ncbi:hypothetical protein MANES_08G001806v8 [Manihot esculenta]|uniref:Uncharacterized protein n=1 Tax=Manihot esculenta TaxID=3983 RepID=A0ACB7H7K1_MANES|nr:hypothetical protein MANES_08G001806v8 [Manihot esculenta]